MSKVFVPGSWQEIALEIFLAILKRSPEHGGHFRVLMATSIAGEEKPLLIVGSAHKQFEDGHLIAVLNPSRTLYDSGQPTAGTTYAGDLLKETVSGECDAMVELWVDAYKEYPNKVSRLSHYQCRTPRSARMEFR